MSRVINIWLTPDKESAASEGEVADYLGISVSTLQDRLRNIGEDHYLTYYPGKIPAGIRRFARRGGKDSKLKDIKIEVRHELLHPTEAKAVVIGLILLSQKHYKNARCAESKAFLLNEGGMLEWYLSAFPGIDTEAFLKRMSDWVSNH